MKFPSNEYARRERAGLLVLALSLVSFTMNAQVVNDGASATLANVTTNITGTVTVGTNGSFTLLTLADNALLNNSLHGIIGLNATARSNEVRLVSPTARWLMGGDLAVGSSGSFSRFVVSNGARAENNLGSLAPNGQSSNNLALVTGNGSLWSNRTDVIVGWFGRDNQMVVSDGGRVVNVAGGTIGSQASAPGNVATVTGNGSIWNAGSALTVGYLGANNRLVVEAGGRVDCGTGRVGYNTGSDNLALVTGAGSSWSNISLEIGGFGPNNQLIVSNGASVVAAVDGFLGHDPGASNNVALVTGAGSMWTIGDGLLVGYQEGRNQLVVSNGAVVADRIGHLGYFSIANNNVAVVTGAGSVWSSGLSLNVGFDGSGNRLDVSNGGVVFASNAVQVGATSLSANNRVVVNGGTLRAANAAGTSVLDVRRGTNVLIAGLIDVDRLLVTNGAGRFELRGGTLITRGAFVNNGAPMSVGQPGGGSAFWDARPGLTNHFVSANVIVGNASPSNQLLVSSGARLTNNGFGLIGLTAGANGNGATVTGSGSRWEMANELRLGDSGAFNRLTVGGGGRVASTAGRIGVTGTSSDNLAVVTGAGSIWSNTFQLFVGETASGNQLQVDGGGLVVSLSGSVGQGVAASGNTATVTGSGSEWRVANTIEVGTSGSFNQALVSGGATVRDMNLHLGVAASSSTNTVVVTGSGSVWTNQQNVIVGFNGPGNQLLVANGGAVLGGAGSTIGSQVTAPGNVVTVTGNGSVWSSGALSIGNLGSGNRLLVEAGGRVNCTDGRLGYGGGANNLALVTGAGSVWSNSASVEIGGFGANNTMIVSNGAVAVTGVDTFLGHDPGASNNLALVTGDGSLWTNNSHVYVGYQEGQNQLLVSNGGRVVNDIGYVGYFSIANNNLATVTGAGSVWSNRVNLIVGLDGAGNRLVVSNGGSVLTGAGSTVGSQVTAPGNVAIITGNGSVWSSGALSIGNHASGNRLQVEAGGRVNCTRGAVGFGIGPNNLAVVTGSGSVWSNSTDLQIGGFSANNSLVVSDGGTVIASNVFVGLNSGSTNNRVTVNGGMVRAANAAGTGVLDVRGGTNVLNAGRVDVDQLVLTNKGTISIRSAFGNGGSIALEDNGAASPYPSTIAVAGLVGSVTKVTVTLSNLTFPFTSRLEIWLSNPAGQSVMLMSDVGGSVTNVMLTFDDSAAALLPQSSQIVTGTYRPTDYPPTGPYSTNLSSFNGSDPNGDWELYISGDCTTACFDHGALVGWSVQIGTDAGPFLDPGGFEFNGGTLVTRGAVISNDLPFIVGGPGGVPAIWEARAGLTDNFSALDVLVGSSSSFNQLVIPSGIVTAGQNVIVGSLTGGSSNNLLRVTGGTLRVLNPGTALDVRDGTNRIDAGLVDLLHLVVTNTRGQFEMFGGTLRTPSTTVANGRVCIIGANTATFQMLGGTHMFSNNLTIATNGSLIGTGVIDGTVTVAPGGRLTPGSPIGRIDVLGSVILQGTVNLQIDKSGGVRTNDKVTADGAIFYNGTLNVTDIGTDVLAAGDRFFLFDATPYVGAFTTLNLPPLGPGLSWQNNLSSDGSIEVATAAVSTPGFSAITRTGTNVVFAGTNGTPNASYAVLATTNVALPLSNWVSIATNQFNTSGGFRFTNAIASGIRQRFFRLRTP